MSQNIENVDPTLRVTRSSMRTRRASSESVNLDSDSRPETPTGRLRATKKLDPIDEKVATPTKRLTRAGSIQRDEKTTPASPLRRTTRRMSSESDVNQVSSPARSTRGKKQTPIVIESEDDDIQFVCENPATPRSLKSRKRVSAVVKLEGVVEEEQPEIDESKGTTESLNKSKESNENEGLNKSVDTNKSKDLNSDMPPADLNKSKDMRKSPDLNASRKSRKSIDLDKSSDSANELELRNRSISKSPCVNSPNRLSLNKQNQSEETETEAQQESTLATQTNQTINLIQLETPPVNDKLSISQENRAKKFFSCRVSEVIGIKPNVAETFGDETFLQANQGVDTPKDITKLKNLRVNIDKISHRDVRVTKYFENFSATTTSPSTPALDKSLKVATPQKEVEEKLDSPLKQKRSSIVNPSSPLLEKSPKVDTPQKEAQISVDSPNNRKRNSMIVEESLLSLTPQKEDSQKRSSIAKPLTPALEKSLKVATPQKEVKISVNSPMRNSIILEKSLKSPILQKEDSPMRQKRNSIAKPSTPLLCDSPSMNAEKSDKRRSSIKVNEDKSLISRDSGFSKQDDEEQLTINTTEKEVAEMIDDFVCEQTQAVEVNMAISDNEEESVCDQTNQQIVDMDIISTPSQTKKKNNIQVNSNEKSKPVSWNQSIRSSATKQIDNMKTIEKEIIKDTSLSKRKIISSDESESDDEIVNAKNLFIDNEAEVASGDEESITTSERNYLEENEIVEGGESIGSQDSDEMVEEEGEEEEEENDSFIDDDEVSEKYSMDSHEEEIEEEEVGKSKKRKSRIIVESSSSDNEEELPAKTQVPKASAKFSDDENEEQELPKSASKDSEDEPVESSQEPEEVKITPKIKEIGKKRRRETLEVQKTPKRIKVMSPNESEAMHMEDKSNLDNEEEQMEVDDESEVAELIKKKKKKSEVPIEQILERTQEYMKNFLEKKKEQSALKKERKLLKLAKKKEQEGLDSSKDENKENSATKKKKKNKNKKQKHLDDIEDNKKEDLAEKLSKIQEKLELKRQRKREKKLAKMASQAENISSDNQQEEENDSKENKQKKKKKVVEQNDDENIENGKGKSVKKDKGLKKINEENGNIIQKKEKKKIIVTTHHSEEEQPQEFIGKKSKKRTIEEVSDDNELIEKPKAKKQLKILKQMEEPLQKFHTKKAETVNEKRDDHPNVFARDVSVKLRKVIPKELDNAVKIKSKKKTALKKIAEPKISLPRPVFTTAGFFIEEEVKPFEFKSTQYNPTKFGSSSHNKIIAFEGTKKKKQVQHNVPVDFKTQMLQRKTNRDKSMKNLKNLI